MPWTFRSPRTAYALSAFLPSSVPAFVRFASDDLDATRALLFILDFNIMMLSAIVI